MQEQFWPSIFAATIPSELQVSLHASGGRVIFGSRPSSEETVTVTRGLDEIGLPWRLEVRPRQLAALYRELNRRQDLYLAMSLLVLALLIFGSYLTARTVKRELEIARLKSEFVSTVSHEFRSPLTGIRQLGEMLLRGRWKNEQRRQEYYQMIVRESDRLTRLVENLLDFSRMEEGHQQYDLEPVEPTQWLQKLVEAFQSEVADENMSIVASIPGELPVLSADREALTCAVHNLLDNAVKYSGDSKTVWLDAEAENGRLSIQVRDRGLGIPEEDQKHIFEKFFRGGGEISRQVKGAGLGLSLVKQIVTTHGGSVQFNSLAGQGSRFSIHLPTQPHKTG
jgi:signal transduction histidine kinase